MKQKLLFQSKTKEELFNFLKNNKKRKVLNFLNLHDIYQINNEPNFKNTFSRNQNLNFIDGFVISAYLSFKNFKRVPRTQGSIFTQDFFLNKKLSENKKHFFIGIEKEDLEKLKLKFPHLKNPSCYNPSYVKGIKFSESEIEKISKLIKKQRSNYVWVGVGSPKQNLLSFELFEKTNAQYFMNVGAALDFLLDKKQEAPKMVRKIGIEWVYRLVTDFKHSRKKVWRSLIGLKYLFRSIKLE